MQIETRALTIGETLVANALARRRRFAGIDTPTAPAIREAMAGKSPPERMAEHLRELEAATGAVHADDLVLKGWSESEIAEHGPAAIRIAAKASERVS